MRAPAFAMQHLPLFGDWDVCQSVSRMHQHENIATMPISVFYIVSVDAQIKISHILSAGLGAAGGRAGEKQASRLTTRQPWWRIPGVPSARPKTGHQVVPNPLHRRATNPEKEQTIPLQPFRKQRRLMALRCVLYCMRSCTLPILACSCLC